MSFARFYDSLPTFRSNATTPTYYYASSVATRIDHSDEMKKVVALVEGIRAKVKQLDKAWRDGKKGAGSVDYSKHTIMKALLDALDAEIQRYNAEHGGHDQDSSLEAEVARTVALIKSLQSALQSTLNDDDKTKTIETKRDNYRDMAGKAVDIGPVGGAATIASITPWTFLIGVVACAGAAGISALAKKYFELDKMDTASARLVTDLAQELTDAEKNLQASVNASSAPSMS